MDSTEVPVYDEQEQSAYNGHFESTCYHQLLLFRWSATRVSFIKRRAGPSRGGWWRKVEFHCGELFPRVGFIVTNFERSSRAVVRFYK